MASLARMVMEGTSFLGKSDLKHHYDHESGAGLIAMESAEALRDIFECTVHKTSECDIRATMEGASDVWSSTQASVMEGIFADAFEKIKQFFIKLKDKVKEFLHNVKRYLTGIFGNDEKWVKTYKNELKAIPTADLKGYKIKMYTYKIDQSMPDALNLETEIDKYVKIADEYKDGTLEEDKYEEKQDKAYEDFAKTDCHVSDLDDADKDIWSYFRNDATSESDMDDVEVSSIMSAAISTLETSTKKLAAYDKVISKTDSAYNKLIKELDKRQKEYDKIGSSDAGNADDKKKAERAVTAYRILSSRVSKTQSMMNKYLNAWKTAAQERNAAYKKALTGAFGYARRHKGGK